MDKQDHQVRNDINNYNNDHDRDQIKPILSPSFICTRVKWKQKQRNKKKKNISNYSSSNTYYDDHREASISSSASSSTDHHFTKSQAFLNSRLIKLKASSRTEAKAQVVSIISVNLILSFLLSFTLHLLLVSNGDYHHNNIHFAEATFLIGECNFERYATGCYSQANLICDIESNTCKCQPESPILIEDRLCVKRLKLNDICLYNEQCDNGKGYFCTHSDFRLVNQSIASSINVNFGQQRSSSSLDQNRDDRASVINSNTNRASDKHDTTESARCRQIYQLDSDGNPTGILNDHQLKHRSSSIEMQHQQPSSLNGNNENDNFGSSSQFNHNDRQQQSFLTRLIWIVLVVSIAGVSLFIVVFFKSQFFLPNSYNSSGNSNRGAMTINSPNSRLHLSSSTSPSSPPMTNSNYDLTSPDNPPPYEVAIRMNLTCHEGIYTSHLDYRNQSLCSPYKYLADNPS